MRWIFLIFFLLPIVATPAWAYGDPNSAGLLYQALLPILAMGVFGLKAIWRRLKKVAAAVLATIQNIVTAGK